MRMKRRRPKIKTLFKETTSMDAPSVNKIMLLIACFSKRETHLNRSLAIMQIKNKIEEVVSTVEEFHSAMRVELKPVSQKNLTLIRSLFWKETQPQAEERDTFSWLSCLV
jgi:hypothetical protein